jgi:hypothetical protein
MTTPFSGGLLDRSPSLLDEGALESIRVPDEAFEIRLQMQQYELCIKLEAEGVAKGGFDGKAAQIVRGAPQAPQHGGVGAPPD